MLLARHTGTRTEISDQVGLGQNDSRGAINLGSGRIAAGIREISDGESCIHDGVHRHHRSAAAGAVKTDKTLGIFGSSRRQLCEIKCAAMIVLFDCVGDAFESSRWMIEFARDFDFQLRMTRHGVIINRNAAIGCDELTLFGQHKRIDFQRPRLNAARSDKQLLDRIAELRRLLWRECA